MAKDTYAYGKRHLFIWQKTPIHMAKETYSYGKRHLFIWQKRPDHISIPVLELASLRYAEVSKETYHKAKETHCKAKETY